MKTATLFLAAISLAPGLLAQGTVNFANTPATLISVGGTAMPGASTSQFIFALFLAPSTTVTGAGQTVSFNDSRFYFAGIYNTNHPTASGRLVTFRNVAVSGWMPGQTVDFVVRSWSASAGATWEEALAKYNSGFPMYIGSSTVGNDLVLGGGAIQTSGLFGSLPWQVGGFNMPTLCLGSCLGPVQNYPVSQTVNRGAAVELYFGVYACPPTQRYQWSLNGVAIPGATGGRYQIANAQPTDAGDYWVEVENICDGLRHSFAGGATLTVVSKPFITSHPQSDYVVMDSTVRLYVGAVGPPPMSYQWFFNSNAITSATSSELWLTNIQPSDCGRYTVCVSNNYGAVTSAPAMLNVMPNPPPSAVQISTSGVCAGVVNNLRFSFGYSPYGSGELLLPIFSTLLLTTNDIGRQFTVTAVDDPDFTPLVSILTNGGPDWVGYDLQSGPCGSGTKAWETNFFSPLPPGANGVDFAGFHIVSIALWVDQLAFSTQGNATEISGRFRLLVNFEPSYPPSILNPPLSQTIEIGSDVSFSLRPYGSLPLYYQWFLNGTNAITSFTTNQVLQVTNVQLAQAGAYTVVVTNVADSVTSTPAMLGVIHAVERRRVPGILLTAKPDTLLNVEWSSAVGLSPDWTAFPALYFTNSPQFFFDLSSPLPPQRFYRAWQTTMPANPPSLGLNLIPALTLAGIPGEQVRVDGINQLGPTDAWFTLDTVTLTNTTQLYFDVAVLGQPARLYRLVPLP